MTDIISRCAMAGISLWVVVLLLAVSGCDSYQPPSAPSNPALDGAPAPPTTPTAPTAPSVPTAQSGIVWPVAPMPPPTSPTDPIVGRYTLEAAIGSGNSGVRCESFPPHLRTRTYTADIHRHEGGYAVKLYEAAFSYGQACFDSRHPQEGTPICHRFLATLDIGSMSFHSGSEDEWDGNEIWERPDGGWLQVNFRATGEVRDGVARIEARGRGNHWYGRGRPDANFAACSSDDFRLTFTRQ